MRVVYNAPINPLSDATELHIKKAFEELGHKVVESGDGDIYLFHKKLNKPQNFTGKVVCWYFDKIWKGREEWFEQIYPQTDYFFFTDGDWAKKYPKTIILRQGIGDYSQGKKRNEGVDVAFTGSVYDVRKDFVDDLKKDFNFKVYNNKFNKDLNDLCASIPIFVAPVYPNTDDYWSNRVYMITGSGGFLIHPRLKGLEEEWGDNLVYYDDMEDLKFKIRYYLDNPQERELMRQKMFNYCKNNFTYKHRVQKLIQCLNQ